MLTLTSLGPSVVIKEFVKRVFGLNYTLDRIVIKSDSTFRFPRYLRTVGYEFIYVDNEVLV